VVLDTLLGEEEIPCNYDERGRLLDRKMQDNPKNFYFQDFEKLYVLFKKIRSSFDKIFCNSVIKIISNL